MNELIWKTLEATAYGVSTGLTLYVIGRIRTWLQNAAEVASDD